MSHTAKILISGLVLLLLSVIVVLLLTIVGGLAYYIGVSSDSDDTQADADYASEEDEVTSDDDTSDSIPDSSQPPAQPTPQPTLTGGIIEGSLGYPSEGIPEDMEICAENVSTADLVCTQDHITDSKYTYGVGYELEVKAGSYTVYAQIPGDTYKAYYSDFVVCGMDVSCTSHESIVVIVTDGFVTDGVDPQDWYNF